MKIILASASPRRKELLKKIYDEFEICPSSADETLPDGISCDKAAEYLASAKAFQVAENNKDSLVIGCDTVVICGGRILGKPSDEKNAAEILRMLSGRTHRVITGVCLCYGEKSMSFSSQTYVEFYELSDSEINDYIATGEPSDKAGAYGIQGLGGLFVRKIDGDFYNVVGLPAAELNRKLKQFTADLTTKFYN